MAKITSRPEGLQRIGSTVSKDQPITISPIDAVDIDRGLFVLRGLVAGAGIEIELLEVESDKPDFGDVIRITATGGTGPGTPASRWLNGSGAPAASLGTNGDYYINTANGEYFAKAANTWTLLGDLTGPVGDNGISAYEVAVANGFVGTQAQWIASLKGVDGKSAYEVAVAAGFVGTSAQWLDSLKGAPGEDGEDGDEGKSAYEVAVANGFVGTAAEWLASLEGEEGKSAYEVAVAAGFVGTEAQWLASLKGADGKSAYELAVAGGFVGTAAEWLASLKGTPGDSAYEIAVKAGFTGTQAQWLDSLHGKGVPAGGTAGQILSKVDGTDYNTQWIAAPIGSTVNTTDSATVDFSGDGSIATPLTAIVKRSARTGNALITETDGLYVSAAGNGKSAYEVAVDEGFVGTEAAWLESLIGKSAYEEAVSEGFSGTEAEWLESLVGKSAYKEAVDDGFTGTETEWLESLVGKSAYKEALDDGFVGTEAQWLESLVGKSAYQEAVDDGFVGTEAAWLETLVGKSAYKEAVDDGFVGTETEWLASLAGKSAYQEAVDDGFVGTEAEWVESLKGEGVPVGGTAGQILSKVDGTDYNTEWVDAPSGSGVPAGGTTGQVLTKTSNTDGDATWANSPAGLVTNRVRFRVNLAGTDISTITEVPAGITVAIEEEVGLRITHNLNKWAFLMTVYAFSSINGYLTRLQMPNQQMVNVNTNVVFLPAITTSSTGADSSGHFYVELFF